MTTSDERDEVVESYTRFLRGLSPENRERWNQAVELFTDKFSEQLAANGLKAGLGLVGEGDYLPLDEV